MEWKTRLGVPKRAAFLYNTCVEPRTPVPCRDIDEALYEPRRDKLLREYATVHAADGYDDVFGSVLRVVCQAYDADADAFWVFAFIVGLQRPYRPIHSESDFNKRVDQTFTDMRVELCLADPQLMSVLETTLREVLPSVVARWHATWFACVGASVDIYDALVHSRKRARLLNLLAAQIFLRASANIPRTINQRNGIYHAVFRYRILDGAALLDDARRRL